MRIAVFRTGTHTDAKGNKRDWTKADLDKIASMYDPSQHEAPAVIGHPKDNAPAYGWVESLERVGDTLWAEVKPTVEEFTDCLKKGLFKKRSISLYPDMSLRHIGFLGAQPPAIKGLPDFAFAARDAATIEFEESDGNEEKEAHAARASKHGIGAKEGGNKTKPSKYKDIPDDEFGDPVNYRYPLDEEHIHDALSYWAKPKDREQYSKEEVGKITRRILAAAKKHGVQVDESKWKFTEERRINNMNFWDRLREKLSSMGVSFRELFGSDNPPVLFTEQDIQAKLALATQTAKDTAAAEFAEKERVLKDRENALNKQAADARKKVISDFIEGLKKKGIILPAMEKLGMGITSFLEAVAGIETSFDFAEPDDKGIRAKQTPLEFVQQFLTHLPKAIEFKELATDNDAPASGDFAERREKLITEYMKNNKDTSYRDAMLEVSKKHPEIFERERR